MTFHEFSSILSVCDLPWLTSWASSTMTLLKPGHPVASPGRRRAPALCLRAAAVGRHECDAGVRDGGGGHLRGVPQRLVLRRDQQHTGNRIEPTCHRSPSGFSTRWEILSLLQVYWVRKHVFVGVWHSARVGILLYVLVAQILLWALLAGLLHRAGVYWKL